MNFRDEIIESIDIISESAEDIFPWEALARRVYMSPFHFHRLFREHSGVPPARFIREEKLWRG